MQVFSVDSGSSISLKRFPNITHNNNFIFASWSYLEEVNSAIVVKSIVLTRNYNKVDLEGLKDHFSNTKISKQYQKNVFCMLSLLSRSRKGWKACMLIVMGETKSFKTLLFSLFSSDSSSSAVTHTIISCCIRSRSRRPFLESKSIASTVCRCPVSSFSFSSEPNFLKNELTVAQSPSLLN